MPRGLVHRECPLCKGYNTKRHSIHVVKRITLQGVEHKGVQRWYCKNCRRAFTPQCSLRGTNKYTLDVYEKAAMLYFDQGSSYRGVARELKRR